MSYKGFNPDPPYVRVDINTLCFNLLQQTIINIINNVNRNAQINLNKNLFSHIFQ